MSNMIDSYKVPNDWTTSTVDDSFEIQQGKSISSKRPPNGALRPFLRTANVFWSSFNLSKVDQMPMSDDEISRLCLQNNDILVCEGGDVGRTAVWKGGVPNCGYQNHLHRLRRKKSNINPDFFAYWMQYAIVHLGLYKDSANRTTIPNISSSRLKQFVFPVPLNYVQDSIASTLSEIQSAIEVQDKTISILKELKAATMTKLFRFGLQKEPTVSTPIGEFPQSWRLEYCDSLCDLVTVGIVVTPAKYYVSYGVPCFRSFNIQEDRLWEEDLVFISQESNQLHSKSIIKTDDVLVVRTGYPGTACVVPPQYDGANCIDLIIARPKSCVNSDYLARYINSDAGRSQVLKGQGGLAQQHFNVGALKRMVIAIPGREEQDEISSIGLSLDKKLLFHEARRNRLIELFKTSLSKLMSGEVRVS